MTSDGFRIHAGALIACLFLVLLALFPSTVTESRYAWKETVSIELKIEQGGQSETGLLGSPAAPGPSLHASDAAPIASADVDAGNPEGAAGLPETSSDGEEGALSGEETGAASTDSPEDGAEAAVRPGSPAAETEDSAPSAGQEEMRRPLDAREVGLQS